MISPSKNYYAQWRNRVCDQNFLRDEQYPAERLLQAIWQHQRIRRGELKTAGGKSVRVFHPGFASVEGGPDFRGAVLQIGGDAPCSGDVEVDLRPGGWHAHGHDRNPNFKNVLLHVVWDETGAHASARDGCLASSGLKPGLHPIILPLKNVLDAPLAELSLSLENESLRLLPERLRGKCCAPLRGLGEPDIIQLLNHAARVRFENKAAQFRARARNAGWEQALWENLFRALGYKHNVWPMHHLAEQRTRLLTGQCERNKIMLPLQARLFGISGLLPDELPRKSPDDYLRHVWDIWWRERDAFSDVVLPRAAWKFHGVRPANHPSRRLALVSHWLADDKFISKIESWIATGKGVATTAASSSGLNRILQVERDDFWSWHITFKSGRSKKTQPLLGDARATDMAVNVILPWLWIRAVEGGNEKIQSEVERRFFAWPPAEDNSVLKLARQRLLGISNARYLKSAAAQQGLIQIIRDFCEHTNATCNDCQFPELVRGWSASRDAH